MLHSEQLSAFCRMVKLASTASILSASLWRRCILQKGVPLPAEDIGREVSTNKLVR